MSLIRAIFLSAAVSSLAGSATAETAKVHMGLTPAEFGAFVRRAGWTVSQPVEPGSRWIAIRVPGLPSKSGSLTVKLHDCDQANRCRVAMLATFFLPQWRRSNVAYVWNRDDRASRGFGGNRLAAAYRGFYMRLQQPLYLRGVTDLYLKEMLGSVWARNRAAFAKYMAAAAAKRGRK